MLRMNACSCWVNSENFQDQPCARLLSGNAEGAISDCTEAIQLQKEVIRAWVTRSSARLKVSDLVGAMSDAEEALRQNPKLSVCWSTLGQMHACGHLNYNILCYFATDWRGSL